MTDVLPPAAIFIIGGLLVPLIKGKWKSAYMLLIPVVGFINLINIPEGTHWVVRFMEYDLIFGKVDRLSLLFLSGPAGQRQLKAQDTDISWFTRPEACAFWQALSCM